MSTPIDLVCLDLAGTTVSDEGLVEHAFIAAIDEIHPDDTTEERAQALKFVTETMGQSKIAVFRELFGDEQIAERANRAFERAYGDGFLAEGVEPIAGAEETIRSLRASGHKVCLLTGFSVITRDLVLDALGWHNIADLALCPEEAGRGRPHPDLVLSAVLRLGIDDVKQVAVCGDTAADIETGLRAGASIVAGVLTGADSRDRLAGAGATHVLDSVVQLPSIL